ncbi:MAG TPA: PE-PPE domain-containing protein [Mycobacterium sp.]
MALLPVVATPTAGAAVTDLIARPATVLSVSPLEDDMHDKLRGAVCQTPNTCTTVPYFAFITVRGVAALQNALTTTPTTQPPPTNIIVFGYSNGAMVAEQWLKQHLTDPNVPSSAVLSLVVMGNPTRAGSGSGALHGEVWPQSDYQVIDVARQYDGPADFPNNPTSRYYLLAIRNAHAGFIGGLHDYTNVNINDPANAVWTSPDGNITYVLVPTQYVPILGVFAPLFPALNAKRKAEIETAYIRPVPFPTMTPPALPATSPASALSTSVVSEPTVGPAHTAAPVDRTLAPLADTSHSVPTAAGSKETNDTDTGGPSAADALISASLPDAQDQAAAVEKFTPPAAKQGRRAQPGRHRAPTAAQSTTGPTTDTRTVDHRMATTR